VSQGVAAPTNVAKIALALADRDDGGNLQLLHYEAGVGTRRGERLIGGAFGVVSRETSRSATASWSTPTSRETSSTSSASVEAHTPLAARSGSYGTAASCGDRFR
jgi:hypothetical protein